MAFHTAIHSILTCADGVFQEIAPGTVKDFGADTENLLAIEAIREPDEGEMAIAKLLEQATAKGEPKSEKAQRATPAASTDAAALG